MNWVSRMTESGSAVAGRKRMRNACIWNMPSSMASSTVGTSAANAGMRKPSPKIFSTTAAVRPLLRARP
ncbi:hypothetical protein SALBM135S_08037 [Streptomyces alboniger]